MDLHIDILPKKEFSEENLKDQLLLAKIMNAALLCSHFTQEKQLERGYTVINQYHGRANDRNGSSSNEKWQDPTHTEEGYTRELYGVVITQNGNKRARVRIWPTGMTIGHWITNKGDLVSAFTGDKEKGIPASETYAEETSIKESPTNQVEIVKIYLNYGFFEIFYHNA